MFETRTNRTRIPDTLRQWTGCKPLLSNKRTIGLEHLRRFGSPASSKRWRPCEVSASQSPIAPVGRMASKPISPCENKFAIKDCVGTRCSSPRTARGPKYTFRHNLKPFDSKSDVYHPPICGGNKQKALRQVCHRKFDKPTITQPIGSTKRKERH